uniref:SelT-like protein n=1 Tax=Solanum lycopersicum TaxID=4081 RepID=A0A3Q7HVW4_SOLLC
PYISIPPQPLSVCVNLVAMDRTQLLLVGLPLFLFISDLFQLFTPPPQKPNSDHHHHHHQPPPLIQQPQTLEFPTQKTGGIGAVGIGNTVTIDFCSSCSYRGTAVTMKNMLDNQFLVSMSSLLTILLHFQNVCWEK